jgi:DNA-directed RNA polymerase specialized sigma24 family protein
VSAALVVQQMRARSADAQRRRVRVHRVENAEVEMAFYRKYTEGMLRRFMYRSMEMGRVPSLLGDFSFRGKSSSRRAYTFEDAIVFVHDVERCLTVLGPVERALVGRIALQEYTQAEAAELLGMSVRTVVRRYADALDRLTHVFLQRKLMQVPGAY